MINIGFQPLRFKLCEQTSDCDCGDASCNQLAFFTDEFSFQIGDSYRYLGGDTMLNGDFSTVVGGGSVVSGEVANWSSYNPGGGAIDWNASTNEACAQGNPLTQIMYQDQSISDCKCYRHIFDIKVDIPEDCTLSILLDDGTDTWSEVIATYSDFEAEDDVELYFCASQNWTRIGYQITGGADCGETSYCIDNIELREYDINIDIYECCDDTYVDSVNDCDIVFTETNVLVQGLWSDYVSTKKCYRFQIDELEIVVNGTFNTNLDNWTQTTTTARDWDWNSNAARCDIQSRGQISEILSQDIDLETGGCGIPISFKIDSAGQTAAPIWLYVNGEIIQTFTYTGSAQTAFTYTIEDIATITSIGFQIKDDSAAGQDFFLDDVSIALDLETDCVCVDADHSFCTTYLESNHHENTTDFVFETGFNEAHPSGDTDFDYTVDFKFHMRLNSRIINPRYPTEEELYLSSAGISTLNFSKNEKIWQYQMNRIPEYMLDAVQRMWSFDNVTIDGVRYVKIEGDLEPTWRRSNTKLASGQLEIKKGTDNRIAN